MATYRIAVMPGDGIGADVTAEALRVLGVVAKEGGLGLEHEEGLIAFQNEVIKFAFYILKH